MITARRFLYGVKMKLDKKLTIALLETIVNFPVGFLMEPLDRIPPCEFVESFPQEICNDLMHGVLLAHIYILSNSGMIYPQFTLETLQELTQYHSNIKCDSTDFWHHVLPKCLAHYTLTVQGYDYLEKLQQE